MSVGINSSSNMPSSTNMPSLRDLSTSTNTRFATNMPSLRDLPTSTNIRFATNIVLHKRHDEQQIFQFRTVKINLADQYCRYGENPHHAGER
ncbi:MAG: hypothetical protein LBK18_05315 [Prevotellaceae bacterium]|nr:hypothetical protein [Prevotellaceae bacterium]